VIKMGRMLFAKSGIKLFNIENPLEGVNLEDLPRLLLKNRGG
jgi:hypothetical protein